MDADKEIGEAKRLVLAVAARRLRECLPNLDNGKVSVTDLETVREVLRTLQYAQEVLK